MEIVPHISFELLVILLLAAVVLANVALEFIARWRNPPIGEFLDVNGVRLHFIIRGDPDAPPLVMFHGNGTLLQDLTISGLVDGAASKFRVICFDPPGFGHSNRPRTTIWSPERQAELFCAALTRLGIERTLVLGHSWGTLVALAMAARNGERVKGLVLVSGYYFPTWRVDVWFASIAAIPMIGDALRYTVSPISLAWPSAFREENFRAPVGARRCQKRISAPDADPPQSVARGGRGLGFHAVVRGDAHDVIPPPRVPHRDHRRTRRQGRRQRPSGAAAEGNATRRRDARTGCWPHGALFRGRQDRKDGRPSATRGFRQPAAG
jgi:pimeloyl-ACP methyl ester carboxylesterase